MALTEGSVIGGTSTAMRNTAELQASPMLMSEQDTSGYGGELRPMLNIAKEPVISIGERRLTTAEMLEEDGFGTSKKQPAMTDYNDASNVETLKKNPSDKLISEAKEDKYFGPGQDSEALEAPIIVGNQNMLHTEQL